MPSHKIWQMELELSHGFHLAENFKETNTTTFMHCCMGKSEYHSAIRRFFYTVVFKLLGLMLLFRPQNFLPQEADTSPTDNCKFRLLQMFWY